MENEVWFGFSFDHYDFCLFGYSPWLKKKKRCLFQRYLSNRTNQKCYVSLQARRAAHHSRSHASIRKMRTSATRIVFGCICFTGNFDYCPDRLAHIAREQKIGVVNWSLLMGGAVP